jgi:hypothetical protein
MANEEDVDAGPWHAGAIGKYPQDDALVWRDDAVSGPQFFVATPHDAMVAAAHLNGLERMVARLRLLYGDCAQCGASLQDVTTPPHCDDCTVDDAHSGEWDEAVGV